MQLHTSHALKEWAVAVEALEQAKTIMLLRKGGIHEQSGRFRVAYNQVLLYPTYEHQQPALLKPEYADTVIPVTSGWHPETVRIGSWAEITDILPVSDLQAIEALLPFHIWNEKFISDRLKWKSRQPLYVLLLRVYIFPQVHISYRAEYGGCKSWIDIAQTISVANFQPVLSDAAYAHKVAEIRQTMSYVLQGLVTSD
ncbi:DUF1802 family protein [Gloeocapsopsis crepidinum LEGE 06123]|uniref:DUF1802 family protein n=1 Tax=Gloeocapsopsis crepidinum LEGE 06123 TaxID=588587 RepID=A0ABR9UVB9_9CHRO|nr:DUF1802 family protein [Gloeocapsopsis crepidinum]MBE9192241.1 DUF1802 family protein [Gloeocapsopsis crepidinum LEGE 06123]